MGDVATPLLNDTTLVVDQISVTELSPAVATTLAIISYIALIVAAIIPIWIGSHRSLVATQVETLSTSDAYMFPLIGSAVLLGLYVTLQVVSTEYLNIIIGIYFSAISSVAISRMIKPILQSNLKQLTTNKHKHCIDFKLFREDPLFELKFDTIDIVGVGIGAAVGATWVATNHWLANNIMGLALCVEAITILSLPSFAVGAILLVGLFFYDIFWVFATNVMVSVATKFNAPIKLLFPKNGLFVADPKFSLLGLGDIVIPGIFIALMLRFDLHMSKGKPTYDRTYFVAGCFSYIAALSTTIFVVHHFHAAQPALLYLVPALLLTAIFVGLLKRELKKLVLFKTEKKTKKTKPSNKNRNNKKNTDSDDSEMSESEDDESDSYSEQEQEHKKNKNKQDSKDKKTIINK